MRRLIICEQIKNIENQIFTKNDLYMSANIENPPHNMHYIRFNNAKNLLGQNFNTIIFNAAEGNLLNFNLTAFAIAQGTLKAGGDFIIIVPNIMTLNKDTDFDSNRYFSHNKPCPHFFQHFENLFQKYHFIKQKVFDLKNLRTSYSLNIIKDKNYPTLTKEQAVIFNEVFANFQQTHIITSPRGRGKSALLAEIANHSVSILKKDILFCARSSSVMKTFWHFLEIKGKFISPDNLTQIIKNNELSKNTILIIDEAASINIDSLMLFCDFFDTCILATTTNNYEGTGNGFLLKFIPAINKKYKIHKLTTPLRFLINDPLENFCDELLVLNKLQNIPANSPLACFDLLKSAHYQTSPNDLRRLFDDDNQFFIKKIINNKLIGCAWLLNEGNIAYNLIEPITQGKRRIKGNLVVQYLALHLQKPTALSLKSARISRIAVDDIFRNQGIGSKIIQEAIQKCKSEGYDFLSVSYGETKELYHFWHKLGFIKIAQSHKKAAATGLKSAIMILPFTIQAVNLVKELTK